MATPSPAPHSPALADVVERALVAYQALGELGEQLQDEWQYVTDLVAVHSADLRAVAVGDPKRVLRPSLVRAVDLAIEEIGLIADAHRAIDWLSTFPQVVRLAITQPGT